MTATALPNPAGEPAPARWNPWPWALIAFFALLLTFIASYTTFAVHQRVDLVGADYYDQEVRYQGQIDRLHRTAAAGSPANARFDAATRQIVLTVAPARGSTASPPTSGTVKLYRPSDARLDRDFPLALDAAGRQQIDAAKLPGGLWRLRVTWTAGGEEFYQDLRLVLPGAER